MALGWLPMGWWADVLAEREAYRQWHCRATARIFDVSRMWWDFRTPKRLSAF